MSLGRKTLRTSQRGEAATAKELGGKRQPASGATKWAKGDVKTKDLLVERKDTWAGGFRLTRDDLAKIKDQARLEGKTPVFQIGYQPDGEQYAVIEWDLFTHLLSLDGWK